MVSGLSAAVGGVFWLSVLVLLLRWPGRTLGLAVALMAWTAVGSWAFWLILGLVMVGAAGLKHYGPEESLLKRYRLVGVFVGSAAVALVAQGPMSLVALFTALGALAGVGWTVSWGSVAGAPPAPSRETAGAGGRLRRDQPRLVDETTCDCGGQVVAMAWAAPDRWSPPDQGLVAWASCGHCNRRFLGYTSSESNDLTWFEVPPAA